MQVGKFIPEPVLFFVRRLRILTHVTSLSLVIAVIGITLSSLLFYLVRQEVNSVTAQKLKRPVAEVVQNMNQQISDDEHLVGSMAGFLDISSDVTNDDVQQFISVSELGQNTLAYVFTAQYDANTLKMIRPILKNATDDFVLRTANDLSGVDAIARYVVMSMRPATTVLSSGENGNKRQWLVIVRPIRTHKAPENVIIGLVPIEQLFADMASLHNEGVIGNLEASEDTGTSKSPFMVMEDNRSEALKLFSLPDTESRLVLSDRFIRIVYSVNPPHNEFYPIVALPFLELFIGILLTLALIMYLRLVRERGSEITSLALSLRRANADLNTKIGESRETEIALIRAKEQADFANRSKSEFLANMSHELRTPLNAIIGFAEIIKDQLFGPVGQPQYVEYAQDIYDSGGLLLSLINDILDMSKIEAGKRTLSDAVLDVDDVIHSVVRLVASRAKLGKLHLNMKVSKELPSLRAEERALKQILTNLLTNAIKFTPEGGDVTLSASIDDLGRMSIAVQDTGIGIAADDIHLALTPFGQIESALSRKNQGTGLGLPLTKALVELHGGTLDLQSEPGQGTTVTIIFPAERVGKT